MPSPKVEDIQINPNLEGLKVTSFYKKGAVLNITFGEKTLLQFDIDKKIQNTKQNLQKAAEEIDLDAGILGDLKLILARDYQEYLTLQSEDKDTDSKSKDDKSSRSKSRDDKEEKLTSAAVAVGLAINFCQEFFIDILGQPYAAIKVGEHIQVVSIKSDKFKNWISKLYYDVTRAEAKSKEKSENPEQILGDVLSTEALMKCIRVLIAQAEFSNKPRKKLYIRTAKVEDGTIYYDLTDPRWHCVKITSEGWSIINSPPLFRRYGHQIEQDIPDAIYSIDIFNNFLTLLNISQSEDNKLLFKCYIISMFYYGIIHAALMLHGEKGTAKTTLQELIRMLVDPSAILTLSISFDVESMAQKIAHNYVCFFDNISKIPDAISDLFCRAITGSGFMKRELFKDDEDIIYQLRHCIGITGVNLAATKSDLVDRGLIIEHFPISKKDKKRLKIIWDKFYELRPKLLGYIFDILVKVLKFEKEHPEGLQLEKYPRLADFAEVCEEISQAMGNKPMAFMEAYERNVSLKHRTAIEDSSVGRAIQIFIDKPENEKGYEGTISDLLGKLKIVAFNDLQITSLRNAKLWPQTSSVLSRRINEIKADLREIGIIIEDIQKSQSRTRRVRRIKPNLPDSKST